MCGIFVSSSKLVNPRRPSKGNMEIAALQRDALALLDQSAREALHLARDAHTLARMQTDKIVLAHTALTLATVLNRIDDACEALELSNSATTLFSECAENDLAAQALVQAAWAHATIGDLDQALTAIERARALTAEPLIQARCDWIQGNVSRGQAHYPRAIELLKKARDVFQSTDLPLAAARCERDLAHAFIFSECVEAMPVLKRLQDFFLVAECRLDALRCDCLLGSALTEMHRYPEALALLLQAWQELGDSAFGSIEAEHKMMLGICYRHLNRYDDSLKVYHQARDYFFARGIRSQVSACDINLGNTYFDLNRYDEALALYQESAAFSIAEGREIRAARIFSNMGLVYSKQGNFSKALDLHHRALNIAESKDLAVFAAHNHSDLANCYRQLGQYDEALAHMEQRDILAPAKSMTILVARQIDLAALQLARGEIVDAISCLEQARNAATAEGLESYAALCDRLLAQAFAQSGEREHAIAHIANARTLFLKHTQIVDAALCDLLEGELYLEWMQVATARDYIQRARAVLSPAFPDQAWRTEYGLGRCAAVAGDNAAALDHYLHAVRTIAMSRSMLVTEQISNDFFARRRAVFDEALALAFQQNCADSALEIIEASKARTFMTCLQNRDWKLRDDHDDPRIADLITRERDLRYQLAALRRLVMIQAGQDETEPLRGRDSMTIPAATLQEYDGLSRVYEAVVTQLRLAIAGLAGVAMPAPFALDKFRSVANSAFDSDWIALDYYLSKNTLTMVVVGPNRLTVECKTISDFERALLDDCTTTEADVRELVYRGTLHGATTPTSSMEHLKRLHQLLLPNDLGKTLIVSPHGRLHALPFHALVDPFDDTFLIEQHPLVYAPNLQTMQLLLEEPVNEGVKHPLVVGVSNFGPQIRPLASAEVEAGIVSQAFGGRGTSLIGEQATRRKLRELDAAGELRRFDVLHFATHAMLDGAAPHQSRVLLVDDPLTVTDILDLTLDARLVTLSACQTALGKNGSGDERIGLTRAFFYAGARALLATLWHVEDHATLELTRQFYGNLMRGENAASALRQAQITMIRAGFPPYQWASFALMGRP
jgi:CHAT domain-containing protein/tetratricopeptide (TPR) repeat protein